jgi:hypothetical protein
VIGVSQPCAERASAATICERDTRRCRGHKERIADLRTAAHPADDRHGIFEMFNGRLEVRNLPAMCDRSAAIWR